MLLKKFDIYSTYPGPSTQPLDSLEASEPDSNHSQFIVEGEINVLVRELGLLKNDSLGPEFYDLLLCRLYRFLRS